MGHRKKICTRIGFTRIGCTKFATGRLFLFTVALLGSVILHVILTLHRISPERQYPYLKWMENKDIQKFIEDGRKLELIRASKGIWTVEPIGRLGNLMGQYATLYALAKLNGKQAYILPKMHRQLSKLFKLTLPVLHDEVASRINWTLFALHDWMSEEYRHITFDYVKLIGYTSSWTFYHCMHDEILREFSFHDFIKQEAHNYLSMIQGSKKAVTFVGVHIRRGDYARVMPKIWKGVLADESYIKEAMDYFERKYTNPVFVVTSNDMDWCRQHIHSARGEVYFSGDGLEHSPGRDFALLAHCNHTIMTIGTFGFWVGYLVGGDTVYLANFTLPESEFLQVFRYEAAYLPHWTGIRADLSPLLRNETKP